ncbi:MAG: Ketol-acid reductoisomerase [bacterium ADurb.Bin270]|nr:MAG: Ketol-acid reductoisomerase [bacterium ADurb.Bin270]HQH80986.1 ketol-acid reductoisomerase [bacterium]
MQKTFYKARSLSTMNTADEKIVIFGFGAQGRVQAQNLQESGLDVTVSLRPESPRIEEVRKLKLTCRTDLKKAASEASICAIMLPDSQQAEFYSQILQENLRPGAAILFAHGLAVHYGMIAPRNDIDVILVAPLAHGIAVREEFLAGSGVPCAVAVAQDFTGRAFDRALFYGKGISKDGPFIKSTFREEVETDLFAEQVILCGGLPELIRASFETLVSNGYNPEIAYQSSLRELHPILSLMEKHGIEGMRRRISDTARFGAVTRGKRIVDSKTRVEMNNLLSEIKSGKFIEELKKETASGFSQTESLLADDASSEFEKVHRKFVEGKLR